MSTISKSGVLLASLALASCNEAVSESDVVETISSPLTFSTCGSNCSSWVYPSTQPGNPLIYVPDDEGDRVPDFARIGYDKSRGGLLSQTMPSLGPRTDYAGPNPRSAHWAICRPDPRFTHGSAIQAGINQVAARTPNSAGVRGHLFLPRGHYALWETLVVPDGVVLVGESQEPAADGTAATTLHACGGGSWQEDAAILVSDPAGNAGTRVASFDILDEVVPVGSTSVIIYSPNPTAFKRRDRVLITRKTTPAWIADVGMTDIWTEPPPPGSPCTSGRCFKGDMEFERTVTHMEYVAGQMNTYRVFFEHPLTNALERRYGPHTLELYGENQQPKRANNAGVYRVRGRSHEGAPQAEHFVVVHWAIDCWAKDIVAEGGFPGSAVTLTGASRQNTVQGAKSLDPGGPISGGFRYSFQMRGHMNLIANATADHGRHDFVARSSSSGPNAFLDCDATNAHSDSGTHDDWSLGTLFDRINVQRHCDPGEDCTGSRSGSITADNNRIGDYANTDSHGWSGANLVVWNSKSQGYKFFNPPTAQNWLIGSKGDPRDTPNWDEANNRPFALLESLPHYDYRDPAEHGTTVQLTGDSSLFKTANGQWRAQRATGNYEFEVRHYFIGDPDQLTGDIGDTPDLDDAPVYVNPSFATWVETQFAAPAAKFDTRVTDHNVPFTVRYQLGAGERVVHAYLAARLERTTWTNDAFHHLTIGGPFFATGQRTTYHWRCNSNIPNCTEIPSRLTGPEGWTMTPTYPVVRVLDLGDQTFIDYLNTITGAGVRELNVNFGKRTRVDWAALTMVVRRPR